MRQVLDRPLAEDVLRGNILSPVVVPGARLTSIQIQRVD